MFPHLESIVTGPFVASAQLLSRMYGITDEVGGFLARLVLAKNSSSEFYGRVSESFFGGFVGVRSSQKAAVTFQTRHPNKIVAAGKLRLTGASGMWKGRKTIAQLRL